MIKKFSFPQNQKMVRADVFNGFFGSFYRCGSAAFPNFRGGISSPPAAAKCVRTNLRILHHVGNCKFERFASLRSATNSYSILGAKTNWRFRILGEENFLILKFENL
jgi:hypothetical protein